MTPRHELIKYRLRIIGKSCAQIANELDVSHSVITRVLQGRARSRRVEQAVADALNEPVEKVFPDRYPRKAAA